MGRHRTFPSTEVAVYDGDELRMMGTVEEVAEELKVRPETIAFYLTPTYQKRLSSRESQTNSRTVVRVDGDD